MNQPYLACENGGSWFSWLGTVSRVAITRPPKMATAGDAQAHDRLVDLLAARE